MNRIEKLRHNIRVLKPLLLSHHPNCKEFHGHTIRIGKYDFCIGCFFSYIGVFVMLLIFYWTNLSQVVSKTTIFIWGIILSFSYILSIIGLTKIKIIKIMSKISMGIGLTLIVISIWNIDFSISFKIFTILIFINIATTSMNIYRFWQMGKVCDNCEYHHDWDNCPGMGEIWSNIIRSSDKNKSES